MRPSFSLGERREKDMNILEILENAKDAKPIGMIGDKKAYSFRDYMDVTTAAMYNKDTLNLTRYNPDGTPAATPAPNVAVNVENTFLNRYKVEDDKLYVVTDYWCIREQSSGMIPYKQIPCFIVKREGKNLKLDKMINISDKEFLEEFTGSLDRDAMELVQPLLVNNSGIDKDKLPI